MLVSLVPWFSGKRDSYLATNPISAVSPNVQAEAIKVLRSDLASSPGSNCEFQSKWNGKGACWCGTPALIFRSSINKSFALRFEFYRSITLFSLPSVLVTEALTSITIIELIMPTNNPVGYSKATTTLLQSTYSVSISTWLIVSIQYRMHIVECISCICAVPVSLIRSELFGVKRTPVYICCCATHYPISAIWRSQQSIWKVAIISSQR